MEQGDKDRSSSLIADLLTVVFCYSLFMLVASLVGITLSSLALLRDNHPESFRKDMSQIWTVAVNSAVQGILLGIICGLVVTALQRIFKSRDLSGEMIDRAVNALRMPMFIVGVANGVLSAILTVTKFRGAWIWNWIK